MKNILIFFAILLFYNNSIAQQLVYNTSQVYLLEQNEEQFINKSLKNLLKEIKPEIKTATVFNNENSSLFIFKFTTLDKQRKREGAIEDRLSLIVFVNEIVNWNWKERPKGAELNWTPNDAQKFADYIIFDIEVVPFSQD